MTESTTAPGVAALHEVLECLGGESSGAGDEPTPRHYGDPAAEYHHLRESCGLIDRSWTGRLVMCGADRHRYLNGQITCDVAELAAGHGRYGFVTSPKGRIEADIVVLAQPDCLWLELPAGLGEAMQARLGRYIIVDRVEIEPLAERIPMTLAGPEVASVLGRAMPEELWDQLDLTIGGVEVRAVRQGGLGLDACTLWVPQESAAALFEHLAAEAPPVGLDALDMVRLEAGQPWFGRDFGPQNLPQETGLDDAVSYTKGCYLGQEVIARLHYRGQVSKALKTLRFEGEPPAPGTELQLEDRPVGEVTSVGHPPGSPHALGLALVQRRAFEPGTRLQIAGGGEAEIASPST